ncbi:3729_t:CDS:2 [Diversispora eburnea]|uniref:3729_t:CDS:1 n=1 Tax=Diversispora eburnea TaxID=1213867 RepID=A0A9N9CI57_9GLOM|nr:3729_t:CDS:2 [Diversispora eburnea]
MALHYPCCADTIVRIKYVRKTEKNDTNLLVVWAIGVYPIEREDSEIEMVLFVPIDLRERVPETQAVFEKDSFYPVGGKLYLDIMEMMVSVSTGLSVFNKALNSNKCSLKVSL